MKTTTQMLREYKTSIHEGSLDTLEYIERTHLLLAFYAGQRNELTFDQWYEATFNTETK
jgi:hypothetical protein